MFASTSSSPSSGGGLNLRERKRPAPGCSLPWEQAGEGGGDGSSVSGGCVFGKLDGPTTPVAARTPTFRSLAKRARTSSPPPPSLDGSDRLPEELLCGPHRGFLVEDETSRLSTTTKRSGGSDGAVAGSPGVDDNDDTFGEEREAEGGRSDCNHKTASIRGRLDLEVEALTAAVEGWHGGGIVASSRSEARGWCLSGLRSWRERVATKVTASAQEDGIGFDNGQLQDDSAAAVASADSCRDDSDNRNLRGRQMLRHRRKEARREMMRVLRAGIGKGKVK